MFRKIILIATILLFKTALAQNSGFIYYDKDWKVTSQENASYYRPLPLKEVGDLVLLQDFYLNGTPQFEGYTLKNEENGYVGDIVWYDEAGNDTTFRQYYNNTINTTLIYYHASGKIRKKVQYKKGVKDGETIIYDTAGNILMKGIYEQGKPLSGDFEIIKEDYESSNSEDPQMQKAIYVESPMPSSNSSLKKTRSNKKTITQKFFWANSGKIAQEQIYAIGDYRLELLQQKDYDQTGKLMQTITENDLDEYNHRIHTGKVYKYYLQNNFATGLESVTTYLKGDKSGKALSYYPKGGVFTETNYAKGLKEGEEITYSENGTVKNKRIYKENEPFQGNFEEQIGNLKINSSYVNGVKDGETIGKTEEQQIVAKGIYKNGKPFNGTFIIEKNSDQNEFINVENYQQTGLQKVFNYRWEDLEKSYTIKNEKLNGLTTFYDDGKVVATLEYKDDLPFEGSLVEDETTTIYKNGKIASEIFYADKYSKDENQITKKKEYESGILMKILDRSFTITEDLKKIYEGILKNGKLFSGYFETEENREFKEVNFYENGELKFQYSNDYLQNMDNYRHQTYDIKSTYKDGKIYNGVEYLLTDRQYISRNVKNGVLQSFDWDLFAFNYFNRIHFEVKGDAILVNDLQEKKNATIKIENSDKGFTKKLLIDSKLQESRNYSSVETANGNYYERITLYFIKDEKINSATIDLYEKPNEDYGTSKFIYTVYNSIDDQLKSVPEIFTKLSENVSGGEILDKSKDESTIAALVRDSTGKPKEGILITDLKNNTYDLQLFQKGKMIKSAEKIPFKEIEKEIEKIGKGH